MDRVIHDDFPRVTTRPTACNESARAGVRTTRPPDLLSIFALCYGAPICLACLELLAVQCCAIDLQMLALPSPKLRHCVDKSPNQPPLRTCSPPGVARKQTQCPDVRVSTTFLGRNWLDIATSRHCREPAKPRLGPRAKRQAHHYAPAGRYAGGLVQLSSGAVRRGVTPVQIADTSTSEARQKQGAGHLGAEGLAAQAVKSTN